MAALCGGRRGSERGKRGKKTLRRPPTSQLLYEEELLLPAVVNSIRLWEPPGGDRWLAARARRSALQGASPRRAVGSQEKKVGVRSPLLKRCIGRNAPARWWSSSETAGFPLGADVANGSLSTDGQITYEMQHVAIWSV